MNEPSITHVAANEVLIGGRRLRQRCAWCGAVLLDYDLTMIAVPDGVDPTPSTWVAGSLVRVSGTFPKVSASLGTPDELPADACGRIDDEVTSQ